MKHILFLMTGGTIASEPSEEGLKPTVGTDALLQAVPELAELAKMTCVSVMSIDSTNMDPSRMVMIANTVRERMSGFDGIVIAHGTDTMAYTAAALTYLLGDISIPVILTGSQVPLLSPDTDAKQNLIDAFRFACDDRIRGVYLAFYGKLIYGTRAMKVRTKGFDAFESINENPAGEIVDGNVVLSEELCNLDLEQIKDREKVQIRNHELASTPKTEVGQRPTLCEDVFVLKLYPGMREDIFDYIRKNYRGVVIECFGIGGVPNEHPNLADKITELLQAGVSVALTTQCLYEGIDLGIYEVGRRVGKLPVIDGGDMTTEALLMKLMVALSLYSTPEEIKKYVETPVHFDRLREVVEKS